MGKHLKDGDDSFSITNHKTGVRQAAAIDRREGGKRVVSGKWTAIEQAFDYWAQKLRVWLDKERAM